MRYKIAGWAGLLGVLFFVGEAIVGGLQIENYSHARQFISETYASGTPWSDMLRFGGVLPAGVLFTVFAFLSASKLSVPRRGMIGFIAFGVFYGLGTMAAAFFPCDHGCDPGQADPTISHILHFASGTLTYLFTPFCLVLIGVAAEKWPNASALPKTLLVCGAIMFAGVLVLFLFPVDGLLGLNQRIIEGAALVSIVRCSQYLLSRKASMVPV
ncbi:MAG: DUF998 domain-containing protein [Flavobacteriales bacterium]|nr:DUF998 domain-containing protein [Flavobacteriales bacterium]